MKRNAKKLDTLLRKLNDIWDSDYLLFSANRHLILVEEETGAILSAYDQINSDGGDPDWKQDEFGNEYLAR